MSDAADIRDRFASVRDRNTKLDQFDELVQLGKWKDASKLATELGADLPQGQVVRLDRSRARR